MRRECNVIRSGKRSICLQLKYILALFLFLLSHSVLAANFYQLRNGLQLLVQPNQHIPAVLCSVWYKVGSSNEHDGITGISHVLEHLMFDGTAHYDAGDFARRVAAVGGMQNAFTATDFTVYFAKVPASFLSTLLKLEADRMQYLRFDNTRFKNEMQVIQEERRLRINDNPRALAVERFMAMAHINNPYHHPIIGWKSDLDHLTLAEVNAWYKTWYVPNNVLIIISGDVKPLVVRDMVARYFASMKRKKLPAIKPRSEVLGLGIREVTVHRKVEGSWLVLGYATPGLLQLAPKERWKAYALDMLVGVLSSGNSGRLEQSLIYKDNLATSVDAGYNPYLLYDDLLRISATPLKNIDIGPLKHAIFEQVNLLKTTEVSADELVQVKAQVLAHNVYRKAQLLQQVIDLGEPAAVGLPWQEEARYAQHIQAVTAKQVQQVAQEFLKNNALSIAVLKP